MCLTELEINDYLNNKADAVKKEAHEAHLAECGACLEKVIFVHETVTEYKKGIKRSGKMDSKKNLWLFGAITAFCLSFFMRRFFLQWLTAAILLGAKWILDSANTRILISIYEAWKRGGEKEAGRVLEHMHKGDRDGNNQFLYERR